MTRTSATNQRAIVHTHRHPIGPKLAANILLDRMGLNPIGVRAAIEICGVGRVVSGSGDGPIPHGIDEHVGTVKHLIPSRPARQQVFSRRQATACSAWARQICP